jgi:acyl carrier protein
MRRDDIVRGVCECVGQVIDADPATIREEDSVIEDLGADSLDLLDLVFHLEQRFKVRITPRGIERAAQEKLGGVPVEVDGVYTPEALAELRQALPEVPERELQPGLRTSDLPRRFRVATFVNLVSRLVEDRHE